MQHFHRCEDASSCNTSMSSLLSSSACSVASMRKSSRCRVASINPLARWNGDEAMLGFDRGSGEQWQTPSAAIIDEDKFESQADAGDIRVNIESVSQQQQHWIVSHREFLIPYGDLFMNNFDISCEKLKFSSPCEWTVCKHIHQTFGVFVLCLSFPHFKLLAFIADNEADDDDDLWCWRAAHCSGRRR